jgi:muconolactone delta-isomerase
MKLLAISNNTGDPTSHIPDEMRRIAELQAAGVIQQLYLKADRSGAVMFLEAESADQAEAQLASLPLVEHGVTSFEVTEIVPPPTAP